MQVYRPKHYSVHELVGPDFYDQWGEQAIWFIDQGLCHDADFLREYFNASITINDWHWGGEYTESGLRTEGDEYYNSTSGHAFGKAFDIKVKGWKSKDVQAEIKKLAKAGKLKHITRLEVGTEGWTHIDCFNAEPNHECGLYVFRP